MSEHTGPCCNPTFGLDNSPRDFPGDWHSFAVPGHGTSVRLVVFLFEWGLNNKLLYNITRTIVMSTSFSICVQTYILGVIGLGTLQIV
jgi:hypothetical protein